MFLPFNDSIDFLPAGTTILATGYYYAKALGSVLYACKQPNKASKSTDQGTTWVDFAYEFPSGLQSIFPSKDGILFASSGTKIYRSEDDGANWTEVLTTTGGYITSWGWTQSAAGTIYAGEYSNTAGNVIYIWRTTDDGDNWTRLDGLHTQADKHVHVLMVDPETGRLYATIGDTPKATFYSDDNGDTWTQLFATRAATTGFTGITSIAGARFFSDDLSPGNNQILKTTDDSALSVLYMPSWRYNNEFGTVVSVHGTNTLFCSWFNQQQLETQSASIMKSTDAGATWSIIASSRTGGYKFRMPADDYRHRIPAELGYFICDCVDNNNMIRIPL